jgi:hypothetical protein
MLKYFSVYYATANRSYFHQFAHAIFQKETQNAVLIARSAMTTWTDGIPPARLLDRGYAVAAIDLILEGVMTAAA